MIAQRFGFIRHFTKERNNSVYFRLSKMPYGFKDQARARQPGEKCGLKKGHHQQGHQAQHLAHGVDGGSRGILCGVAYGIASDGGEMGG